MHVPVCHRNDTNNRKILHNNTEWLKKINTSFTFAKVVLCLHLHHIKSGYGLKFPVILANECPNGPDNHGTSQLVCMLLTQTHQPHMLSSQLLTSPNSGQGQIQQCSVIDLLLN